MDSFDVKIAIQKYKDSRKYLEGLASLKQHLTDEHLVELYEKMLHDTFIETLRLVSEPRVSSTFKGFIQIPGRIREPYDNYPLECEELFSIYIKSRKLAAEVKNELKLKAAKESTELHIATTPDSDIPTAKDSPVFAAENLDCTKPAGKPNNKFYNKRTAFLAQLRSIVTFNSCTKMSRSERILRLIEEFETASVTARLIAGEGDDEENSLLGDGLLVSLAMSKLDEESLAQLAQQQDSTIIPTWVDFREELLRLTKEINSPQHQDHSD